MASSSGCAIKRHIRLLCSWGKVRANGEELVEDRDQKMMRADTTRPSEKSDEESGILLVSTELNSG